MSTAERKLNKGDVLFREGDPSDACYVVKSGKIVITKAKGNSEIELASIGPGQMLGEMAFFDNKPRSATAKAGQENTVAIALPFSSLNAQFQTFPQWLKAMVKTVNENLREANKRIKNLEQAQKGDAKMFPPHTITKLCAILSMVGHRFGEKTDEGVIVPSGTLRNYTIQIFQEPTHKMQKLMDVLQGLGILKLENLGEGKQKLTVMQLDLLQNFVDFYNRWLFSEEAKRVLIENAELKLLRTLLHFTRNSQADEKGMVKLSLNQIQNDSMKELGFVVTTNLWNPLIEKKVISEPMQKDNDTFVSVNLKEIREITPYWEIVYALESIEGTR